MPDSSQLRDYFEPLHINLILSKFNNVNKVPVIRSCLQTCEDTQAYLLQEDAFSLRASVPVGVYHSYVVHDNQHS